VRRSRAALPKAHDSVELICCAIEEEPRKTYTPQGADDVRGLAAGGPRPFLASHWACRRGHTGASSKKRLRLASAHAGLATRWRSRCTG